jgi:hypothetical protein
MSKDKAPHFNSLSEFYGDRSNPEGINQYTVGGGSGKVTPEQKEKSAAHLKEKNAAAKAAFDAQKLKYPAMNKKEDEKAKKVAENKIAYTKFLKGKGLTK